MRQLFIGLFLVLLVGLTPGFGQNLVPNPSFEDTVACPYSTNQVHFCLGWSSAGMPISSTPDYFNTCSPTPIISPPLVVPGDQNPKTGEAYCFVVTYANFVANGREYIMATLNNTLTIGQEYFISFFMNLGGHFGVTISANKIGVLFTTQEFTTNAFAQANNFSHVYLDTIISDTINWFHFKQSFIADSNYQYLTIGNFFDDLNTDTIMLDTNSTISGYFIDDVCVSADSTICFMQTSINGINENDLSIYPNPVSDFLSIPPEITKYVIYNFLSQKILLIESNKNNIRQIDCSLWPNGLYILSTDHYNFKFIVHH